jgi:hypothetical protein
VPEAAPEGGEAGAREVGDRSGGPLWWVHGGVVEGGGGETLWEEREEEWGEGELGEGE